MKRDLQDMTAFIDELAANLNKIPLDTLSAECAGQMRGITRAIERAGKEFSASLFLILAFGPVKSGKSTLINILARQKEVSPTAFGIECTLRPSIIIKAKGEPRICRYISKSSAYDADREKENFNLVLDYIRGITEKETILENVIVEEYPFSIEKIQKFVAGKREDYSDFGMEPLVTVIEVEAKDSKLIDEHTAIVDVPGLDGVNANWRNSPIQEWILTRSDFLLFVQSSIAALNSETIQFLKEVYINSKEPPVQLVQNIIEAKHWLGQEYLMEEAGKQRDRGVEEITRIIPLTKNRHFDSAQVNLGKAHDAIFGVFNSDDEDVFKSSGMDSLETKLYNLLCTRREAIMWSNSQKGLKNTLEKCGLRLKELEAATRDQYLQIEGVRDEIGKAKTAIHSLKTKSAKELVQILDHKRLDEYLNEINDQYLRAYKTIFQDCSIANEDADSSARKNAVYESRNSIKAAVEDRLLCYDSYVSQEVMQGLGEIIYKNIQFCIQELKQGVLEVLGSGLNVDAVRYKYMINEKDFGVLFRPLSCDKAISRPKKLPFPRQTAQDYEKIFKMDFDTVLDQFFLVFKQELVEFLEKYWRSAVDKFEGEFDDSQIDFNKKYQMINDQYDIITHALPFYRERIEEGIHMINLAVNS